MQHRTALRDPTPVPLRRLRLIVEDPSLIDADPALGGTFEITVCAGPRGEETCPLVMDGTCPLGPGDVVVTSLDGPWAPSVRAAWAQTGTPVVDAAGVATADPAERLTGYVGAAIQRVWPAPAPG